MITVSYIVLKIIIISLVYIWILIQCSRSAKKKDSSSKSVASSYIEETKLEEKYVRPAWDKLFPKILPPPVRVPEKENKEVDVEPDFMIMSAPRLDKGSNLESDKHVEPEGRRSEILEQVFCDRTQTSPDPRLEDAEESRKKMGTSKQQRRDPNQNKKNGAEGESIKLDEGEPIKSGRNGSGVGGTKGIYGSSVSDTPGKSAHNSVLEGIKKKSKETTQKMKENIRGRSKELIRTDRTIDSKEKIERRRP
ncbi:hypothetical protein RB195_017337 [Necator americanus]|uniref:Uncharacterized protein n=1 Tax=Necator americanus TaxID=51031 RepID=A0ABR1C4R8_NECAM